MPKIPTYNQGQQVPLATGQLGPRLSGAGLEQGMLAGVRTTQQALGAVADIATAFEKRRQVELEETFTADTINDFQEKALEFNLRDQSQNINEYNVNFDAFVEEYKSNLDTPNISKTRNRRALSKLDASAQQFRLSGIKKAFDVELTNTANSIDKAGQNIISQFVSGQMSRELALAGYDEQVSRAERNGVSDRVLSSEAFMFQLDRERVASIGRDDAATLSQLEQLEEQILNGEDEYSVYNLDERTKLVSSLYGRMNEMETVERQELISAAGDALSAMRLPSADNFDLTNARSRGLEVAARLRDIGQIAQADKIEEQVEATYLVAGLVGDIEFSSVADVNQAYERNRTILIENAAGNESKAEYALKALDSAMAARKEAIALDPANYVIQRYQNKTGKQPSPTQIIEIQRGMGLSESQLSPFTNEQFKQLQGNLEQANAQETIQIMQEFFGGFGDEISGIAMSKARRMGMSASQNIALFAAENPRALDLLNAEKIDKSIIKAGLELEGANVADITKAVSEEMSEYRKSIVGDIEQGRLDQTATSGRVTSVFEMEQAVNRLAQYYVVRGMDVNRAAKVAASVITDKYEFANTGANNFFRIPKGKYFGMSDAFARATRTLVRDENLIADLIVPESGVSADARPEATRQIYASDLARAGRWVTSDDDSGVYLVDAFGNPVLRKTNDVGESGAFMVQYSFEELAAMGILSYAEEQAAMGQGLPTDEAIAAQRY